MRNIRITYSKEQWKNLAARARKKVRQELNAVRGMVVCAACGETNAAAYMYCRSCGHPLEK